MFQIEYRLKQHTPIIHFQHDQAGATLRGTELKPKLDAWIMRKMLLGAGKGFFEDHLVRAEFLKVTKSEKPEWKGLLIGRGKAEHPALNYKVRIIAERENERFVISSMPNSNKNDPGIQSKSREVFSAEYLNGSQYFADNQFLSKGPEEFSNIRLGLKSKGKVSVRITCLIPQLLTTVRQELTSFFVNTSFGTRQTKGFGCFLPDRLNDNQIVSLLNQDPRVTGIFRKRIHAGFREKLQIISRDYGELKRGTSFGTYRKSKLWKYLCSEDDIRWEKRKIKTFLQHNHSAIFSSLKYDHKRASFNRIDDCDSDGEKHYQYIRALLGLAEQFEFGTRGKDKVVVRVKDSLAGSKNERIRKLAIKRFKSPIRFITTEQSIYLITTKIDPLLHTYIDNKTGLPVARNFDFIVDGPKSENTFPLTVPQKFDLVDFVEQMANYGNNLKLDPCIPHT